MNRWLQGPIGRARGGLLLVIAGGLFGLVIAGLDYLSVTRTRERFQPVLCYMESCVLVREPGRNDRNLPGWQWVPVVKYRYMVGTEVYSSEVVSSRTEPITSIAESEAFLKRFGPGSDATCLVNPDDPNDAMLELPTMTQAERFAKIGGLAAVLGLVGLGALQIMVSIDTAPKPPKPRAPGWGEIDSGPGDALARTRDILRERLEG